MNINYEKLMKHNPTIYGEMTNSIGQKITFVEHPLKGDESTVLCVCHDLKLAAYSDFYELDDMTSENGDYEPVFIDGEFSHGI